MDGLGCGEFYKCYHCRGVLSSGNREVFSGDDSLCTSGFCHSSLCYIPKPLFRFVTGLVLVLEDMETWLF